MIETHFDVGANAVVQLGENLYKNTYGVLIEYITNSYDADASYVNINIERDKGTIIIKDDGIGMTLDELKDNFLKVGNNRRKKSKAKTTKKGRLVTGRKGFGKLACFGLFKSFRVETIKDNQMSSLVVTSKLDKDEEFDDYEAMIDTESVLVNLTNGTTIYLSDNTQIIVPNEDLSKSIAKRLNIMYEGTHEDPDGFKIQLGDRKIDQSFRNQEVLNHDIRFVYNIPEDIDRFTSNPDVVKYFKENNIIGTIIARNSTVRVEGNKGVVLFARGKLCQEATYLGIQQSNSYGYAHLYAEFHVDFIDNQAKDNIGTDRTALNETKTTKELFEKLQVLIRAYGKIYDDDATARATNAVEEFKKDDLYINIKKGIDTISNDNLKSELLRLLNVQVKHNVKEDRVNRDGFDKFKMITDNITPTYILESDQISKDDVKDNVITSYDHLVQYLRDKYNYTQSDGDNIFNNIYGNSSTYSDLESVIMCLPDETQKNTKSSLRDLGKSIVSMRNSIAHTSDRNCINDNISIENSKRFLIMIDLFIELDTSFFKLK